MTASDRFWRTVRDEEDRAREQAQYLASARGRGVVGRHPRRGPVWGLAAAVFVVFAAALAAVVWRPRVARDLAFTGPDGEAGRIGAWIAAPSEGPSPLRFSDGSLVLLSPGSRVRVTAVDSSGARIVLERGGASASVVHRATSHWVIDVGPFQVAVVGTRFDVSWDSNEEVFRLDLHDGAVSVSGACIAQARSIARGHRLRVSCKGGRDEILEMRDDEDGPDAAPPIPSSDAKGAFTATDDGLAGPWAGVDGGRTTPSHGTQGSVLQSEAWRGLVAAGRYREALDLAERRGFKEECRRAGGADLLELGDAARYAGNASEAYFAYQAARGKVPGGGRSAYALGLLAFDQERDFAAAARWFGTYLAEQPDGNLRQEALGRAMEAWHHAGGRDKAKAAALEYLRLYPNGAQAPLARQWAIGP